MLHLLLPYLPATAAATAWATTTWRLHTCRRARIRERVTAGLLHAAAARDITDLENALHRAATETAILAEATRIVETAAARHATTRPRRPGGDHA